MNAHIAPARETSQLIRLVLPYPISSNRYWDYRIIPAKGGRPAMALKYTTALAKAYKHDVQILARQAGVRYPIQGRYALQIELYPHRPLDYAKRARKDADGWEDTVQCIDLGNCEKVLSDALNGIAWIDDKMARDIHLLRMTPDEHGARVVVTITPIVKQPIAPGLF